MEEEVAFNESLTDKQQSRSAAMRFKGVSTVELELHSEPGKCCGHNFMFSGKVCVDQRCDSCPQQTFCTLSEWSKWTQCTKTCDNGITTRSRTKIIQPKFTGSELSNCNGNLEELESCNTGPCDVLSCSPVDCQYSNWGEWSACNKCGGQRMRSRTITTQASCKGRQCMPGDSKEYDNCPDRCDDDKFCVWEDWTDGQCMTQAGNEVAKCGVGIKTRERKLIHSHRPPLGDMVVKKFGLPQADLERRRLLEEIEKLQTGRRQSAAMAFSVGLVVFAA